MEAAKVKTTRPIPDTLAGLVIVRDRYSCVKCKRAGGELIVARRFGQSMEPKNLVTLCPACVGKGAK